MSDDMIRDVARESVNPGVAPENNQLPNPEIHRGSADQFSRPASAGLPGHARLSPGDRPVDKPAAKSGPPPNVPGVQPGKGDPMDDTVNPTERGPIRASDFARGFAETVPGSARTGVGGPTARGPMTPEEALFGGNRGKFDFGQLTPVDVGSVENRDDSTPRPAQPSVTKTTDSGISFLGRGAPDAWSKDKK